MMRILLTPLINQIRLVVYRQLVIGSGTEAWVKGNSSFDVTIPKDLTVDGDMLIQGGLTVQWYCYQHQL